MFCDRPNDLNLQSELGRRIGSRLHCDLGQSDLVKELSFRLLGETRTGKNEAPNFVALLCQSVFGRQV